jgi:hypothetical protein
MGVLYTCDFLGNEEDPVKSNEVVEIQITISDPENGVSQATRVYCAEHGDMVLGTLEKFGFPAAG